MPLTSLIHVLDAVSGRTAETVIAALWQGLLVAGAVALCLRFAPRISAAYRFAIWASAFVALVGLSMFPLVPGTAAGETGAITSQIAGSISKPIFRVDARWSLAIAAVWVVVALFRAGGLGINTLRLRKLWKDAEPVQLDERVEGLLAAAVADCGRGTVGVCTTTTLQRPSVIGFFKPRILIPDWLYARLTQGELEQIVLHEVEHLRRRDDWTNLLQKLCLVVFPLNPALVWIERRLCREREMACDDGVIRITRAPRAYAACLTSLAERGLERRVEALSLGAWQRRPELVHRVHSILRGNGGLSPMGARILLGAVGCGLLAGSVELAQSPQLVAFIPENSVVAKQAETPILAKVTQPIQISRAEPVKPTQQTVRGKAALASSSNQALVAMNSTLRQPMESQSIEQKVSEAEKVTGLPLMAKAEKPAPKNAQEQQWIVLTAWEQVETTGYSTGLRADYDADATAGSADAVISPDQPSTSRIAVTQLIFRVLPANTGSHSATKPAASPSTIQPGPTFFHEGWLVIQL